mmetsp:Transcript_16401/g.42369  ORF Transcript_16401/g.42369 Transcript_16401/m.42369 type:complete len:164 (-) Transcript_16401:124-615(-)
MAAWKERPRRFIEPPLVTSGECMGYKQVVKKELKEASVTASQAIDKMGGTQALDRPNKYFTFFQHPKAEPVSKEHPCTYDRVNDDTTYDPNCPRDTFHTRHSEAARKKCKIALTTSRQLRVSQNYGWLPPVDEPNYGYGRSSIFLDSSMDKSHLTAGGPWTAR